MPSNYKTYADDSLHLNANSPFFWDHVTRYWWANEFAQNKNVLDCACGKGYGSFILSHGAKSVLGIDLNAKSLEIANQTFQKQNLNFKIQDVFKLGDLNQKFDLITAFEVIEHIPAELTNAFIISLKSALTPNGKLIISTPNHDVVLKSHSQVPSFHINNFRSVELKKTLQEHFSKVTMIGQFRKRNFIAQTLFNLDFINLRHILRNLGKTKPQVMIMSESEDHDFFQKQEVSIDPAFIARPPMFLEYRFSPWHYRQAGLTIAICENN